MTQQQTTLPNGLRIVTTEMPDSRSVAAVIIVGTGSRYEKFEENGGVSHFLEHLLFQGTKHYPTAEAISMAMDAVGGVNNAYTGDDVTGYFIKVPSRHRDLPLKILADLVAHPLLDPARIDRERQVIVEEMNLWRDDPSQFITTLIPELLFPGTSLGHDTFGSEEVVRTISPQTIQDYFEMMYRPHNLVVSVAGRIHHDEVVAQTADLLGHLKDEPTPSWKPVTKALSTTLVKGIAKETAQAHLMMVCRTAAYGQRESVISRVISTLLGNGSSSRLYLSMREREGLAYSPASDALTYVDTGLLAIYAGVTLQKVDRALDTIWEELARIRQELVPEEELSKAKEQLCAALEMGAENNLGVAERAGEQLVLHDTIKLIDEAVAEIQSVTAEEVQQVARKIFEPSRLRLAIIAPDPDGSVRHFERLVKGKK